MNKNNEELEQLRFEVDEFYRELPKVKIGRRQYYRDDKAREFRSIHQPTHRISFEEYKVVQLAMDIMNRAHTAL